MNTSVNLSGLARKLLNEGHVPEDEIISAAQTAQKQKIPLVTYLVQNAVVPARTISLAASEEFGTPILELDAIATDVLPKELVSEKLVRKHRALPLFKRGTRLYVAVADPTNLQALDEIKFNTGLNTEAIIVDEDKLDGAIDKYLESQDTSLDDLGDADLDDLDIVGIYPSYATAYDAWKDASQRTVDNASMRYFVVHMHKLLDPNT